MKVYTIAITGRFGSGKTMISNILKEKGIFLLMVDEIAHDLYEKGTACWNQIIEYFGKSILNATGEIDRKTLGKIVFSDLFVNVRQIFRVVARFRPKIVNFH